MLVLPLAVSAAEELIGALLPALLVILVAARLGAFVAGKLGQPAVVGEITIGLLLGPSAFGQLAPGVHAALFPREVEPILLALGQIGLVFLMFLVGLEFDSSHLKRLPRTAAGIALGGIALPFALGFALAWGTHDWIAADVDPLGFSLFVATTLSITAIPILGRILIDFGIHRTRLGTIVLAAAAIDDVLGWILLAGVAAAATGGLEWYAVARTLVATLVFVLFVLAVARPYLRRAFRRTLGKTGDGSIRALSIAVVAVIGSAIATNAIGIFSVFGPFVLGIALSGDASLREALAAKLHAFVAVFFLPAFFTYTGFVTHFEIAHGLELWIFGVALTAAACAGKLIGCGVAARLGGLPRAECACVAVLMNTRALMGLVAAHAGRAIGVIPDGVFGMLVLMAIVTTVITCPVLRRLLPHVETTSAR